MSKKITAQQRLSIMSQSQLDQVWENAETLAPWISKLAQDGITTKNTGEELEVAKTCCQIVEWELMTRIMRRDWFVKCSINEIGKKKCNITILTVLGEMDFSVDIKEVQSIDGGELNPDEKEALAKAMIYRQTGGFAVFVNGIDGAVLVAEEEIITE